MNGSFSVPLPQALDANGAMNQVSTNVVKMVLTGTWIELVGVHAKILAMMFVFVPETGSFFSTDAAKIRQNHRVQFVQFIDLVIRLLHIRSSCLAIMSQESPGLLRSFRPVHCHRCGANSKSISRCCRNRFL